MLRDCGRDERAPHNEAANYGPRSPKFPSRTPQGSDGGATARFGVQFGVQF